MGSQRVGHDWATELNWTELIDISMDCVPFRTRKKSTKHYDSFIMSRNAKCNNLCFSVQFSCSVVSICLRPHGTQHIRPPCPSPTTGVYPNSCPLSWWVHLTITSSAVPFSSCLQPFPDSGSFQMNQFFASDGQSIGVSASTSVIPMNTQDWSPLRRTVWISL